MSWNDLTLWQSKKTDRRHLVRFRMLASNKKLKFQNSRMWYKLAYIYCKKTNGKIILHDNQSEISNFHFLKCKNVNLHIMIMIVSKSAYVTDILLPLSILA